MRTTLIVFLFFSLFGFAQNTELELKIDSVTSIDASAKQRKFTIQYHIENRTNTIVSFLLNTKSIKSNTTNSLSCSPSYRLYQENVIIDADNIFNTINIQESIQKMITELRSNKGKLDEYLAAEGKKIKEQNSKNIIKSIIKLNPNERRNYTITLDWDINRYIQYFDNEYYLDEKSTHYIDLHINLFKEELESKLLSDDFKIIKEDKTIIKGWLQSNKMEINFKE